MLTFFIGCTMLCNAQINLLENGKISLGTTEPAPFSYMVWLSGARVQIGGYLGRYFCYDVRAYDPRIYSRNTNKIVFYNSDKTQHQDVEAASFRVRSDERYKKNIKHITNSLDLINQLNGVSYNFKSDNTLKSSGKTKNTSGFIAQEVEKVLPSVVFTDDSLGYKTIDYIQILPYVVESLKELNNKLDQQNEYIKELESKQELNDNSHLKKATATNTYKLYEEENYVLNNTPNPFRNETVISYTIPGHVNNAFINIYDLSGRELLKKQINNSGNGQININAKELYNGTFIYSLIVDGKLVKTSKMIITN